MKLIVFGLAVMMFVLHGAVNAGQSRYAGNAVRSEVSVTTNTTFSVPVDGTVFILTDNDIDINTSGVTINAGFESLKGGTSRDYFPLKWDAGAKIKFAAVSTAKVTIFTYDQ